MNASAFKIIGASIAPPVAVPVPEVATMGVLESRHPMLPVVEQKTSRVKAPKGMITVTGWKCVNSRCQLRGREFMLRIRAPKQPGPGQFIFVQRKPICSCKHPMQYTGSTDFVTRPLTRREMY